MKTTLEQEKEIRSIKDDISFYDIGKKENLIPMIIENDNTITEVLFCENISNSNQFNNMPKELYLTKLKMINGELHTFKSKYVMK